METVFLHLLNMSITAGWIALAVIIIRLLLKKAPKWITVLLWGLVGIRLVFPISIESILSLIPSAETVPPEIVYSQEPQIHSGVEFFNSTVNPVISESLAPEVGASINPVQVILFIATIVWLAGLAGMLLYTLISYLKLRHKVKASVAIYKNIYICDDINTPFILGVIKPRIYLPSNLQRTEQEYVLSHEKAHIKRKDHLIKPLSFLLLSVYWFNPILWVAYVLLCRDIELACDEKVIKDIGTEQKKEYSTALLNCSVPRRIISACPLAFGEVGVKQRIKNVLNYKKPAFWISVVAIILCIALSVCFLTNPVDNNPYGVKVTDSGSDIEGVSLELIKLDLEEDAESNASIEIKWKNKNKESYTCGEEFYIYKYIDGEWVNIRKGDYAFITIGYIIPANGTFKHSYNLWNIEIDEVGTYRFASTFLRDKGDTYPTEYTAWVDFEVTKIPDFEAHTSNTTTDYESFEAKDVTHYYCNNSSDVLRPQITLYRRTREFQFTLSALSSYVPTGKYSTEGNILTLTAYDGNKYVFEVLNAENLKFIADKSTEIPKYKYSHNEDARQPFEDGDIFELEPKESTNIVQGEDIYIDFESLRDMNLYFSSGVGAWYSSIHLSKDGSFDGEHKDTDQGASNENYPNGTVYECEYSGNFSNLQKIDDYTYALTLDTLSWEGGYGESHIENGARYFTSYPHGLVDNHDTLAVSDDFLLFLPSTPTNETPEGLLNWWPLRNSNEKPDTLSLYCIYNVETKQAFFTKPLLEE